MAETPDKFDIEVDLSYPSGMQVTGDEPYRILVVGDFAGTDAGTISGPLADGLVEVKADNFDAVMAEARPSVSYATSDPLASGNVMAEVKLTFDSLRGFDPRNLVGQLPAVAPLMQVRERIVERMLGKASTDDVGAAAAQAVASDDNLAWLSESIRWSAGASPAGGDAVDNLLAQLDVDDDTSEAEPPKSPLAAAVSAAAGGTTIPAEEASAMRRTLGEIDRRVGLWLTDVLHGTQVQAIERAWRSLRYLVEQTDFRKGVRIAILHAPRGQLTERFTERVIDPIFDEGAEAPDLIVVDGQFGSNAADYETLDYFAQNAASLPAVALMGVSSEFFGVKHAWQMSTLPAIVGLFDQWQFAKWKTLRDQPFAQSLGVVFGNGLLRTTYGREDVKDLAFTYREPCVGAKDLLWMSGAIAAACTVARSVADRGWPCAMAGMVHGRLEGFSTAQGGKKGDKTFGPTDTLLPQPKIEELAAGGVNALVAQPAQQRPDHSDALIWNGLSAARPMYGPQDPQAGPEAAMQMAQNAMLEVSLPYRLFAARVSVLLFKLRAQLVSMSAEAIPPFVKQHVQTWVKFDGDPTDEQLSVQTRVPVDDANGLELAMTVIPPQSVVGGNIPVVAGYRIR